jgi:D-alanyl-D-alanine-carboxypeptidase/D-alanyl-D-alanine-endopeptidase
MRRLIFGGMIVMASMVSAMSSSDTPVPSDFEIRRILSERIDDQKQSVGIVVGVIGPEGRRFVAHGHFGVDDPRPVNADTVFEIGSITKVFTALLLAEMSQRGEVELSDPVAKYLPEDVTVPQRGGKSITLADLATHTSGLPRMPGNFSPANPDNPYADYSVERLYRFLSKHRLARDIGSRGRYSNLGYGLLGHALARRGGGDYETLVRDRILAPLGMESTAITLSPAIKARLASGHSPALKAVPNWDMPTTFAGAGALRSTASDLLTFLEMALDMKESPLATALAATLATRRPTGKRDENVGLGWIIAKSGNDEMIWHNGGTGGYRSFIGFLPKAGVGVVVLSNTSTPMGVDDIGQHLLNPKIPLAPSKQHVTARTKLYDGYVGRYQLEPDAILSVTLEGGRLFARISGQERFELFPLSEGDFLYVDAQITFKTDGKGHAESLTLHQNGRHMPAPRMDE